MGDAPGLTRNDASVHHRAELGAVLGLLIQEVVDSDIDRPAPTVGDGSAGRVTPSSRPGNAPATSIEDDCFITRQAEPESGPEVLTAVYL